SWKISTLVSSEHIVNTHIKPIIGHYKLKKLTASIYEREFINKKLDDGFKPNSVHRYHTLFKTAINFAVEEEILLRTRFTKIKIHKKEQLSHFHSPNELNTSQEHDKRTGNITECTMTLLPADYGMRKSKAFALKWHDVDFDNKTKTISHTRDHNGI